MIIVRCESCYNNMVPFGQGLKVVLLRYALGSLEKSLNQTPEERHMVALKMERACIDIRNQVTVNGVCQLSSSDVKHLSSDNTRAKSWSVNFQDGVSTMIDTKDNEKSGDSRKPLRGCLSTPIYICKW